MTRVDRDLFKAAQRAEEHYIKAGPFIHLLDILAESLRGKRGWRGRYRAAAHRLFDMVGIDLADFDGEEAVDMLVIASMWN